MRLSKANKNFQQVKAKLKKMRKKSKNNQKVKQNGYKAAQI